MNCQSCGACCVHGGEVTVELDDTTNRPEQVPPYMTRSVRGMMGFFSDEHLWCRRMARTRDDSCIAFRGKVGGPCKCAIYDKRPSVCREYQRGSKNCLAARHAAGL